MTISFDGKNICSIGHMSSYESPLYIVSAQISELEMTFAWKSVNGKSNDIPAVQRRGFWEKHGQGIQNRKNRRMALLHCQPETDDRGDIPPCARIEWPVEMVHWLLDVHFEEEHCGVENKNVQQNLNMLRKVAINLKKEIYGRVCIQTCHFGAHI